MYAKRKILVNGSSRDESLKNGSFFIALALFYECLLFAIVDTACTYRLWYLWVRICMGQSVKSLVKEFIKVFKDYSNFPLQIIIMFELYFINQDYFIINNIHYKMSSFDDQYYLNKKKKNISYPHNCIGLLLLRDKKNGKINECFTGFMIGLDLVLTLASVIWNKKYHQNQIKDKDKFQLLFYPGSSSNYKEKYLVTDYRFCEQYKKLQQQNQLRFDYALLKLERCVSLHKFLHLSTEMPKGIYQMAVFGYQVENHEEGPHNDTIKEGIWDIQKYQVTDYGLEYELQIENETGGSPVLCKKGNQYYVMGIDKGYEKQYSTNEARLITQDMIENIVKWKQKMEKSRLKSKQLMLPSIIQSSIQANTQQRSQFIDESELNTIFQANKQKEKPISILSHIFSKDDTLKKCQNQQKIQMSYSSSNNLSFSFSMRSNKSQIIHHKSKDFSFFSFIKDIKDKIKYL